MADRSHRRPSPPKRSPGKFETDPSVKGQSFPRTVNKKVNSPLAGTVGGRRTIRSNPCRVPTVPSGQSPRIDTVREEPTSPVKRVREVPTSPVKRVAVDQKLQKVSEYARKKIPRKTSVYGEKIPRKTSVYGEKIPRKTSVYGEKKNVQMVPLGNGNESTASTASTASIPPSEGPVNDASKAPEHELRRQMHKVGYGILGHLGSGAHAEVWKVLKQDTGRIWAAKVIQVDKLVG